MTDTSGTFDEPVNPSLPDGGSWDGGRDAEADGADEIPGEQGQSAPTETDGDGAYEATPRDI